MEKSNILVCHRRECLYITALSFVVSLCFTSLLLFGLDNGSSERKTFLPLSIIFLFLAVVLVFFATRVYFQSVLKIVLKNEDDKVLIKHFPHTANAVMEIEYTFPFYAAFFVLSFCLSVFLLSKSERWSNAVGGTLLSFFFVVLFGWLFRNGSVVIHEISTHYKNIVAQ